MRGGPLAGTLSFLLPDPPEAALLAVCLRPGRARAAWATWERGGGDLDRHRALLPLLEEGTRRGGVALAEETAARLRGARLHEILRFAGVREIAADALERIAGVGLDPVVVQDVALAENAYDDPALRHCHALDLLLAPGTAGEAADALTRGGYTPRAGRPSRGPWREVAHASGFPVRLAEHPIPGPHAAGDAGLVRARSGSARIAGRLARVPAPEDALVIVCGRAAASAERRTLLWACDAARLIESHDGLDWTVVVATAEKWGLGLPLAAMLGWLAGALDVPVPAGTIEALEASGRSRPLEPVLAWVRADGRADPVSLLLRAAGWRERWTVLRWTAFPSVGRLRRSYPDTPLPAVYLARPLRWMTRSLTRSCSGDPASGARVPAGGRDEARSGGPPGPAADPPSASRRSSG